MNAHHGSPHVVFAADPPPWRDSCFPPKPGGQHFLGTSLRELLAEPGPRAKAWLASVYARLVVASTGPVLVGEGASALTTDRLERAKWLRLAPDADVAAARSAAWPALAEVRRLGLGVGSLAPDLVIVAERDPYDRLPMFARSGVWLFRALRSIGYDELTVYVTNALDRDQRSLGPRLAQLHEAFAPYDPTWVALGAIAKEVLTAQGLEHVVVDHPSHARRFEFAAGPEGYGKKLVEAGVPPGANQLLPGSWHPTKELELADRLGLPLDVGVRATKPRRTLVPTPILDRAHQAFVMGEALTVKDAAKLASESKEQRLAIQRLAKEQGWEVERERFYAEKRERAKLSAVEAEGKRIGQCRGLAWEVTELALRKLKDLVEKPDEPVYAKDAKAMVDISLSLSEKGDAKLDEEEQRLRNLSPGAFAERLREVLGGFGVQAPEPTQPVAPQAPDVGPTG